MARRMILSITAAALLGAAAISLTQFWPSASGDQSGAWFTSPLPQQFRLYSGEKDPVTGAADTKSRSVELLNEMGVATNRYIVNLDGSTEDDVLKADGEHIAASIAYYREYPPGSGRHKQAVRMYAANSDLVVDEQQFRYSGTLSLHTVSDDRGGQHIEGFGLDGRRLTREVVISPRQEKWDDPVLQREDRWTDDDRHALLYENQIKPDKSRTVTRWDDDGQTLMVMVEPESGVYGTTIVGYYPGTNKKRVEGKATSSMDANYYRLDGTLDHTLGLSAGFLSVDYFDPTGKTKVLEQSFRRTRVTVDGVRKSVYNLYWVKEFGPKGEDVREFTYGYDSPGLGAIELDNVTINGQPFAEVDYNYDKETGFLTMVRYWKTMGHGADIEEPHNVSEKIAPLPVPASDITMKINPDEDDLPVPPPQQGPYGR
jgi:hypothetical protein